MSRGVGRRGRSRRRRRPPLGDDVTWFIRATDAFGRLVWPLLRPGRAPRARAPARARRARSCSSRTTSRTAIRRSSARSSRRRSVDGSTGSASRRRSTGRSWASSSSSTRSSASSAGPADVDAFRTAKRVLDEGHVLIVFPEGTRSPTGDAPGGEGGDDDPRPADRCPDRADRRLRDAPRLAARPEAAASRRVARSSSASASRSRSRRRVPVPSDAPPRSPRRPRSWAGSRRSCRRPARVYARVRPGTAGRPPGGRDAPSGSDGDPVP